MSESSFSSLYHTSTKSKINIPLGFLQNVALPIYQMLERLLPEASQLTGGCHD
jgi:hypothetical protein